MMLLDFLDLMLDVAVGPMIFFASLPIIGGVLLAVIIVTLIILIIKNRK